MAQTRLEKVGSIYSRVTGLLQKGAIAPEQRPVWLAVYEAFPPKYEPRWDRQPEQGNKADRKIMYPEDNIRAKYYKNFGDRAETHNLLDAASAPSMAQLFVAKHTSLAARGDVQAADGLFRATVEALELDGVFLLGDAEQATSSEESGKVKDIIASVYGDAEERTGHQKHERRPDAIKMPSYKELFAEKDDEK